MAIVYDPIGKVTKSGLSSLPSRYQGSLINQQKRQIADACEYLRVLRLKDKQRKPLIFCLTSPGYTSMANTPKFISYFVENMRENYGMGEYVWVRELTKLGYPHFHFIADWHKSKWFFEQVTYRGNEMARINAISLYWSSLFKSQANNSVRLGSFNPATRKRTLYLSHEKQAWYLTKYLGKNIGVQSYDYLAESGFPSLKFKRKVRSFSVSEQLAQWSQPTMFESSYEVTATREVIQLGNKIIWPDRLERMWSNDNGEAWNDSLLREYRWRWTGHGQTFIGTKRYERH